MNSVLPDQEIEWLVQALTGDDESFGMLVEAYQRPVYNLCYRMLGNAGDAEDAAQETFLRAYRSLSSFDTSRKFSTWLLSIASNHCIDQHRRRRLQTFSLDALPVPDIDDGTPSTESRVSQGEEEKRIQVLLSELNPVDRNAVIMRYWYDYSYEEIAEGLGLTVSAVKSRLHRARHDLAVGWKGDELELEVVVERKRYESPAY